MEDVSAHNIYKDDVRYQIVKDHNGTPNKSYSNPTEILSTMEYNEVDYKWIRAKKDAGGGSKTRIAPRDIVYVDQELVNDTNAKAWPLVSYQSASIHWISARNDANEKKRRQLHDRRYGYLGCLDWTVNMQSIYDWCMQMETIGYRRNGEMLEENPDSRPNLDALLDILKRCKTKTG